MRWLVAIIVAACVAAGCVAAQKDSIVTPPPKLRPLVWPLVHKSGSAGSCFPVLVLPGRTYILTAAHLISSPDPSDYSAGGVPCAHICGVLPESDLALLRIDIEAAETLELDFAPVEFGERLISMGWPLIADMWATEGLASGDNRMSCNIYPGFSGGPVLRESNFGVIGVNSSILADYSQYVTFAALYGPLAGEDKYEWFWTAVAKDH